MIQVSSDDAISGSSAPPADGERVSEAPPPVAPSAPEKPAPEKPKPGLTPPPRAAAPIAPSASAAKSRVPAPKPAAAGALAPPKPATTTPLRSPTSTAEKAADALRVPRAPTPTGSNKAALGASPPKPAEPAPRAPAPSVVKPAAVAAPRASAVAAKVEPDDGEEEATQIARGALIGAFSAAMNEHAPASVADPLSMPGDEWFVGINGVPLGPIHLSELRSKAASGAINKESLVWRDGFEEWRPLKSFPELVAIVEESLSSARASMPFPVAGAGASPSALADPFAPAAAPPPSTTPAVVAGGVSIDELDALRARPRTSPVAWIAMVVAIFFGVTLGYVLFGKNQQAQVEAPKTPETPVAATPSANAPTVAAPTEQKQDDTPVIQGDSKAGPKGQGSGKTTVAKTETEVKSGGPKNPLGLSGLTPPATKGPSDVGSTGSTGSSGSGQLDSAQLSSVVQRYTPSVKRSCWQPALDGRDRDAPTSARVSVSITIGPSGSVQDASTSGDPPGYRGLAQCIAGRVRGWQFPPSGGSTTVKVPFVFVAQ
ncbi:MAG: GYF domain-containing protein [Polyangiaceae bacterium]